MVLDRSAFTYLGHAYISRVSDQNGISLLCIMLEIHHSGPEPSLYMYTHSHIFYVCVSCVYLIPYLSVYLFR